LFDNADQILDFLELIRADESIEIVKSKNRFRNPTLSGYRDWNLQLQISSNDGSMKHICELQLHLEEIKEAAVKLGSHKYYEFFRKYYAGATDTLEGRLDDLRMICKGGSFNTQFLGDVLRNPLDLSCMIRIAGLFEDQLNDYQLAIIVINILREIFLRPADFFTRMGILFWKQGKLEEALTMHQEALDIRLKALGPDHTDTADSYNNIALVLNDQGKLEEALALYQLALDIKLKALGPDHTNTADSYNNMALVLNDQGKLEEAIAMHQKALGIQLTVLGPDHVDMADTYNNMGCVLCKQGKL